MKGWRWDEGRGWELRVWRWGWGMEIGRWGLEEEGLGMRVCIRDGEGYGLVFREEGFRVWGFGAIFLGEGDIE